MLSILAELTLRGTLLSGLVWLLEKTLVTRIQARSRRLWWAIAAMAFLLPFRLPIPHLVPVVPARVYELLTDFARPDPRVASAGSPSVASVTSYSLVDFVILLWLVGAGISLIVVAFQTIRTGRRWAKEAFCKKPELLCLLEECKAAALVTSPIGLVLSNSVSAPAILGWFRPRILVPKALAESLSRSQLRAVLLHELAHYRALDQPLHWLFTLARAVHWFNPAVHLTVQRWLQFRELAADEAALRWLVPLERLEYGLVLVKALKHAHESPPPYGALALGETLRDLKQRITMISHHSSLARRGAFASAISLLLFATILVQPVWANQALDGRAAASAAAESWLKIIDDGHYGASWENASAGFKKGLSKEQWQNTSQQVRSPLGKCLGRKLVSSFYHSRLEMPNGTRRDGEFVTLHYQCSFEHQESATETLYFTKDPDGAWKAIGYLIIPD